MTSLAIIIPVKALSEGKSRLCGVLCASDRYELNFKFMTHTFTQIGELAALADIYVVSRSSDVLADARLRGFHAIFEPDHSGLNAAVARAACSARQAGAAEVMVLPVDLPWLEAKRLRTLIAEFRATCDVMIVPDHAGSGTNVLLWRPGQTAQFAYGADSAKRHAEIAAGLGLRVVVCQDQHLSFDLDTPQDLKVWQEAEIAGGLLNVVTCSAATIHLPESSLKLQSPLRSIGEHN